MAFVQIIEFRTQRLDDVKAASDAWVAATDGKRTATSEVMCSDRDRAGTYLMIVEFPSYDAAMKNSDLPETKTIADKMAKLCDGPPIFRNLDVINQPKL